METKSESEGCIYVYVRNNRIKVEMTYDGCGEALRKVGQLRALKIWDSLSSLYCLKL